MSGYQLLRLRLPANSEEIVVGELWAAGTLGLETRGGSSCELEILAYFEDREDARSCAARVAELADVEVAVCSQADRDWLAVYRQRAESFLLGSRLEIEPGEPTGDSGRASPSGRRRLRLPARRAFGTGEHATTRLVIEILEEMDLGGQIVLDLGCGSGILSFAAVLWGAGSVIGLEVDPIAAWVARDNQALNRLAFPIAVGRAGCLRSAPVFDLALVNVLPHRIQADLDDLLSVLKPKARVVFSGVLHEQTSEVDRTLAARGFRTLATRRRDEWAALETRIVPPIRGVESSDRSC
jgi:ribosomal protein L11 methyltransferase